MTDSAAGTISRSPIDLPEPYAHNNIARESLWYEFGAGSDKPPVPPWTWDDEPPMEAHVAPPPPAAVRGGSRKQLPFGTMDLLERAPFPAGRVPAMSDVDDALAYALVASFGIQWHDPENAYKVHRGYASPRCLYPVQVFVDDGERWRMLDVEQHALTELAGGGHSGHPRQVVLTGRYTRIPRGYKWFRGSLVNLELGIALRSLCIGLELLGLSGRLILPDERSRDVLVELGLAPTWDWSLPLTVEVGESQDEEVSRPPVYQGTDAAPDSAPDAVLADLVRVNRAQAFTEPAAPLGSGIPADAAPATPSSSWAELMWQRNSGRMPRGLLGMSGRRRQLPADTVRDALRWLTVPPPGQALGAVFDAVTLTGVIQAVDGYTDGIYRIRDGEAVLHNEDPTAAARLESEYGYPLTPEAGCDIRHASMIWFLSVRPRELFAEFGPGGWSAAQYAAGWALHGLCLAAAAAGLFARPVRAFREVPSQRILGLEPDEMIALAAVVGTPKYASGALLDIRL